MRFSEQVLFSKLFGSRSCTCAPEEHGWLSLQPDDPISYSTPFESHPYRGRQCSSRVHREHHREDPGAYWAQEGNLLDRPVLIGEQQAAAAAAAVAAAEAEKEKTPKGKK